MIIKNGLKVYHGSYIKVEDPDLKMCKAGKDFGVGFYVTTDIEQARRFVRLAVFKAQKNGEIANDNTNRVITAYINEIYGKVGSEPADSFAISLLMPEKLTDQICFRTEKAMKSMKFIDFEEVVL